MRREEYEELIALRTRLTIALLAVSQLQRQHSDPQRASRLSRYALDALADARADLDRVDALIARLARGMGAEYGSFLPPHPWQTEDPHDE